MKIKLSILLMTPLIMFLVASLVACLVCIALLNWFEFLIIILGMILIGMFFIGVELYWNGK